MAEKSFYEMEQEKDFDGEHVKITKANTYPVKITDVGAYYQKYNTNLRFSFVTVNDEYYDYYITLNEKYKKLLKWVISKLKLTDEQKQELRYDESCLENYQDYFVEFFKKYIVGRSYTIKLDEITKTDGTKFLSFNVNALNLYELPLNVKDRKYYVKPADDMYSGNYGEFTAYNTTYSDVSYADDPTGDVPFGNDTQYPTEWDSN